MSRTFQSIQSNIIYIGNSSNAIEISNNNNILSISSGTGSNNYGPTGEAGTIGVIGNIGIEGPTGTVGSLGLAGPTGTEGLIGLEGLQGIQGIVGNIGSTGLKGIIPSVSIYDTGLSTVFNKENSSISYSNNLISSNTSNPSTISTGYSTINTVFTQNVSIGDIVTVECWGAGGVDSGSINYGTIKGGRGGYSKSKFTITNYGDLKIVVGGSGQGGVGGDIGSTDGGNGGGASYVYFQNPSGTFDIKVIAGGGGGGGYFGDGFLFSSLGVGGDSNTTGNKADGSAKDGFGGEGGNLSSTGAGGSGGTATSGGVVGGNGSSFTNFTVSTVTTTLLNNGGNGVVQLVGSGGGGNGFGGGGGGGVRERHAAGGGGGGNLGNITLTNGLLSSTVGTPVPNNVADSNQNGYVLITVEKGNFVQLNVDLVSSSNNLNIGSTGLEFNNKYVSNNLILGTSTGSISLLYNQNYLGLTNNIGTFNLLSQTGPTGPIGSTGSIIVDSVEEYTVGRWLTTWYSNTGLTGTLFGSYTGTYVKTGRLVNMFYDGSTEPWLGGDPLSVSLPFTASWPSSGVSSDSRVIYNNIGWNYANFITSDTIYSRGVYTFYTDS